MRRLAPVALALAAVPLAAAHAGRPGPVSHDRAAGRSVAIPGRFFSPARLRALPGETVTWRNEDSAPHTIRAEDGGFRSERLGPGETFTAVLGRPGTHRYVCTIHRYMRGAVEIAPLALEAPGARPAGARVTLHGWGPAGSGPVALEELAPGGARTLATAAADAPGRFSFAIQPARPLLVRARAGALHSGAVRVRVAPAVALSARRSGRSVAAIVRVSPPQPGAGAVLERWERERFGWVPIARRPLERGTGARFATRRRGRVRLRARVVRLPAGWAQGASEPAVVPAAGR